jgi:glycosyltransferase involved in cell wall biosynthesis
MSGIFVQEQVKELVKHGSEIKVISPIPLSFFPLNMMSKKWYLYSKIPFKEMRDGIEVYYPRYIVFPNGIFFTYSGVLMYFGIRKLIQKIYMDFKFDIIHAHVALPDGYAAMMVCKEIKKPFIVTIHGQDLQQTIYKSKKCRKSVFEVFESADKIITVSTKLRRIAQSEIEFNEKLVVINNGINQDKVKKINLLSRESKNYHQGRIILSVSNLIKTKGIDINLLAISKLLNKYSNLKYYIIGDGPEKKSLQQLSIELGIKGNVVFMGKLSNDEVLQYMNKADIFSLPSWQEGFGVVYLEAMACGKPVIACKGEGIEDIIENCLTGFLIEPRNVNSLVNILDFLLGNPEEAKKIGERAKELVLRNYTWENNAYKVIDVYREVMRNGK